MASAVGRYKASGRMANARCGARLAVRTFKSYRVEHRQTSHRHIRVSAGACTALWLAFHDDMADPKSTDPVERESTRLLCAAVYVAQTSLDPQQMRAWTPNSHYGGHAFGFMDPDDLKTRDNHFEEFLNHREDILPWIKEYSPIEHVSADDPPIYLIYDTPPAIKKPQKDPTHTANFGAKLQDKLMSMSVECELVYPKAHDVKHKSMEAFMIEKLNQCIPAQ